MKDVKPSKVVLAKRAAALKLKAKKAADAAELVRVHLAELARIAEQSRLDHEEVFAKVEEIEKTLSHALVEESDVPPEAPEPECSHFEEHGTGYPTVNPIAYPVAKKKGFWARFLEWNK